MDRNLEIGGGEMMMVTDTQKLVLPQSTESLVKPIGYASGGGNDKSAHYKRLMGMRRSNFLLVLLVLMQMSYLCFGAFMFCSFEGPGEQELRRHLKMFRAAFLRNFSCLNDEALESFIVEIVRAHENRVSPVKNVTSDPNWSFGHSFFFSSTIITTIGYGNITPLSTGGKIFCIVYGLIGIPLTLILLSAFVERLLIPVTYILQFLNSRLGHLYQAFNIRVLHLFIVGLLVVVFFFLVPAAIFSSLEPEWDYVDSLYYCFISLTTIGLGDFTPGDSYEQPYRPLYKVAVVGYLLVGLTAMMLLLNVLYDIPQLNVGVFFLLKSDEMTNDPEKVRLHHGLGPKYTQQIDEAPPPQVRHIKARPPPSSSSPEDLP
ncbi:potassium channel subfamily K member 1 isoform X1 [Rhipicephalus microplus]|uniref:potassium channel subfamily K member 1 isoform X1 n=1 Tax=Rhipicephalus microplus TaxID=6941 RepID=UPI001887E4A6|nr:potassium channel subfamily K member 1-like isoform X1 [Rhipicephalus microplus]